MPGINPKIFGVSAGLDYAEALIYGIKSRLQNHAPEQMARTQLFVNSQRLADRLRFVLERAGPGFHPTICLIPNLAEPFLGHSEEASLTRKLALLELMRQASLKQVDQLNMEAHFDLAASLDNLLDELRSENRNPSDLDALNLEDSPEQWHQSLAILKAALNYQIEVQEKPGAETALSMAIEALINSWKEKPPEHPVIIAGSTGSRKPIFNLMLEAAHLPNGSIVLPGVDFSLNQQDWAAFEQNAALEDHPQYRVFALAKALSLKLPEGLVCWHGALPSRISARARLISLALRPAPVTETWRAQGPKLGPMEELTEDITLLEAETPREEALAIAIGLREAAANGKRAALITPDRVLARRVTAALERAGIVPNDSAGLPLSLTAQGRFISHVGELFFRKPERSDLLALLKHPITHSCRDRHQHLQATRALEIWLRSHNRADPTPEDIYEWAEKNNLARWVEWVMRYAYTSPEPSDLTISEHAIAHQRRAANLAAGSFFGKNHEEALKAGLIALENGEDGKAVSSILQMLSTYSPPNSPDLTFGQYLRILSHSFSGREIRASFPGDSRILIRGPYEARGSKADLFILAGLTEGSWPNLPTPDPWLNRQLRRKIGLSSPERRIGLAAHDFWQAALAQEIWLCRALRDDDAETIPSRWLNRITNLLQGLSATKGPEALKAMRQRGKIWQKKAQALEAPLFSSKALRPSPIPPSWAQPKRLSATDIGKLIRDPYAIYASRILRLRQLSALDARAGARERGIILHHFAETLLREFDDLTKTPLDILQHFVESFVLREVPWPVLALEWQARLMQFLPDFIAQERKRRERGAPEILEAYGLILHPTGIEISAIADRIDLTASGTAWLYDYKTGTLPTKKQIEQYDKQLQIVASMIERGAFKKLGERRVEGASHLRLGSPHLESKLEHDQITQSWEGIGQLLSSYLHERKGYTALRSIFELSHTGEMAHLARFGEWGITDEAHSESMA